MTNAVNGVIVSVTLQFSTMHWFAGEIGAPSVVRLHALLLQKSRGYVLIRLSLSPAILLWIDYYTTVQTEKAN